MLVRRREQDRARRAQETAEEREARLVRRRERDRTEMTRRSQEARQTRMDDSRPLYQGTVTTISTSFS